MKWAVLPAKGIGDALLMQIAARHLQQLGMETVTCSDRLLGLQEWFPSLPVAKTVPEADAFILQHDNSPFARDLRASNKPVYTLFADYVPSKHGPLKTTDAVFDRTKPFAQNVAEAMHRWFPGAALSLDNGIQPLASLVKGKWPRRVAIHPTSAVTEKNWLQDRFLGLRDRLIDEGFEPVFVTSFPTLSDLAAFLYESGAFVGNDSGPGHLASCLGLPTVTIGPSVKHLRLWKPGWGPNALCYAPDWATELKLTRNKWQYFISISSVFKQFMKLTEK